jgi:hypothetical protein
MLPYDRPRVIFSLSQVQNFLGDEGAAAPSSNPKSEEGTVEKILICHREKSLISLLNA